MKKGIQVDIYKLRSQKAQRKKIHNVTKGSGTFFSISLFIDPKGLGQEFSGTFIFSQQYR